MVKMVKLTKTQKEKLQEAKFGKDINKRIDEINKVFAEGKKRREKKVKGSSLKKMKVEIKQPNNQTKVKKFTSKQIESHIRSSKDLIKKSFWVRVLNGNSNYIYKHPNLLKRKKKHEMTNARYEAIAKRTENLELKRYYTKKALGQQARRPTKKQIKKAEKEQREQNKRKKGEAILKKGKRGQQVYIDGNYMKYYPGVSLDVYEEYNKTERKKPVKERKTMKQYLEEEKLIETKTRKPKLKRHTKEEKETEKIINDLRKIKDIEKLIKVSNDYEGTGFLKSKDSKIPESRVRTFLKKHFTSITAYEKMAEKDILEFAERMIEYKIVLYGKGTEENMNLGTINLSNVNINQANEILSEILNLDTGDEDDILFKYTYKTENEIINNLGIKRYGNVKIDIGSTEHNSFGGVTKFKINWKILKESNEQLKLTDEDFKDLKR
jgi:hypothetical protein